MWDVDVGRYKRTIGELGTPKVLVMSFSALWTRVSNSCLLSEIGLHGVTVTGPESSGSSIVTRTSTARRDYLFSIMSLRDAFGAF